MSELEDHEEYAKESNDQRFGGHVGELRVDLGHHAQVRALAAPQGAATKPHKESSWYHGVELGVELRGDVRHVRDEGHSNCPLAAQQPVTRVVTLLCVNLCV